jgi:hypothetical protein
MLDFSFHLHEMMNFKIIDTLIGTVSGAIIAFTVSQIIPAHWNMFLGMAVGGVIGMVLKFMLLIMLAPFFGAFEVMIPVSLIAMMVGMLSGMAATHGDIPGWCITVTGGVLGFTVAVCIYFSNKKLQRST